MAVIERDLNNNWAVLGEAIQTVMRRYDIPEPYEKLKALTRGQDGISKESLSVFIDGLELDDSVKTELKAMTPSNYIGPRKHTSQKLSAR